MNKIININLGGTPLTIDEDAYVALNSYLNVIKNHFSKTEGCNEILLDIEIRIAELFIEKLKGKQIIGMKELDEVKLIMGRPEDFGAEEEAHTIDNDHKKYRQKTHTTDYSIKTGKRLFRNEEDKIIGGVCSGIAAYFGIHDPIWIRLLFAITGFTGGMGVFAYLLIWMIVPAAKTSSDKLAMQGEPINIESIAKKVQEEVEELSKSISDLGKDLSKKSKH
jgi:phage shock protein PspC (stress-responsive transcriptional regulator)